MKKHVSIFAALLFALSLPVISFAMSHEKGENMDHSGHAQNDGHDHASHGGMEMHGDMIMLGDDTEDGAKAMAHLKDVGAAMSKMGMDSTHHLMVMFVDTKNGAPITEGAAAVKITGPDGKTGGPIRLMGMEGHFGADIALKQKGEYAFEVGTKLADGQKRTFAFKHTQK